MKSYSVKGIKAFKEETNVEIKPITIFVGENSCGKSSLIRFPVVISQSMDSDADAPILFFGKDLDYGNYEDVVFNHSKKQSLNFSVCYECNPRRYYSQPNKQYYEKYKKTVSVDISVAIIKYSKRMIVDSCEIRIEGIGCIEINRIQAEKYCMKVTDVLDESNTIELYPRHLRFVKFIPVYLTEEMFDCVVESVAGNQANNDIKQLKKDKQLFLKNIQRQNIETYFKENYENVDDVLKIKSILDMLDFYSDILMSARMQAMQDADETYYIGPFRENPSRVYRDVEHRVDSVGVRGQDVSVMLKNDYTHGKKVIKKVSKWFENSMGYALSVKDISGGLYNIVVKKEDGTKDNLIDVGYGISQVLPIVTQLIMMQLPHSRRRFWGAIEDQINSTLIIEQPELHLHPNAQAELANLFVDAISQNTSPYKLNVLIETHSEHLIRRLQALIADKKSRVSREDVVIYYVDKNDKNEAFIREMKLKENGQFETSWPTGFFDKAHELSMELLNNNIN